MNTSATGGYLREAVNVPHHRILEDAVHDMITGLTGLDSTLVRPAFQEYPLAVPEPDVDWCAFYIRDSSPTNYPDVRHSPDGGGNDTVTDWQNKEIHLYFYGPDCEEYAGMVRRGLHVEQNYFEFRKSGIAVKRIGNVVQMPEKVNEKWVSRADLIIYATYAASASYPVLDVAGLADGGQIWTVIPQAPGGGSETPDDGNAPPEEESWEEERQGSGAFLNINR
ncbi:MAG: hypothetical protein LBG12_08385 [Synergistaceae bacterium]|jgi:hypothetical protein|nr:hypothetical protein [Synergistaceae bacterium]